MSVIADPRKYTDRQKYVYPPPKMKGDTSPPPPIKLHDALAEYYAPNLGFGDSLRLGVLLIVVSDQMSYVDVIKHAF
jgi:hypothetical protein